MERQKINFPKTPYEAPHTESAAIANNGLLCSSSNGMGTQSVFMRNINIFNP